MQSVSLSDELVFRPAAKVSLTVSDPDLAVDESNTVLRAVRRLQEVAGSDRGVEIFLEKRIPPGSGLGGGSADAAAVLVVLNRWWGLNLPCRLWQRSLRTSAVMCLLLDRRHGPGAGKRRKGLPCPRSPRPDPSGQAPVAVATAEVYRCFRAEAAGRRRRQENNRGRQKRADPPVAKRLGKSPGKGGL